MRVTHGVLLSQDGRRTAVASKAAATMSAMPLEGTAVWAVPPLPTVHFASNCAAVSSTELRVRAWSSESGAVCTISGLVFGKRSVCMGARIHA